MKDGITRRGFIGVMAGAMSLIGLGRVTEGFAAGSGEKWINVGMSNDFKVGEPKLIKDEKLFVMRNEKGVAAMSAKCTHFGCVVDRLADGTYLCPCHSSAFDAAGLVTAGPAKKPLVWYETKEENGSVFVNIKGVIETK